jgi:hypothetical protein
MIKGVRKSVTAMFIKLNPRLHSGIEQGNVKIVLRSGFKFSGTA